MSVDVKQVPIRLNLGCGHNRIEGFVNIDREKFDNVDMVIDLRHSILPFNDNSVDTILLFHTIEHIEARYHKQLYREFWRILQPDGTLYMSYPEFKVCAQYYIDNYKGMEDFWKNTIYGLQRTPGDYHIALMDTEWVCLDLQECGFYNIEYTPEKEEWNTVLMCHKYNGTPPCDIYEENLAKI